jgi:hypothetical protein
VTGGPARGATLHPECCRCTRCRGFTKGNQLSVTHGADSDARIRPLAARHRRTVLRRLGLSPKDLDAVGRAYLDQFVRLTAKLDLLDRWLAENGLLRADGEPQPALRLYPTLANSARATLAKLEDHVQRRIRLDPLEVLEGEGRRLRLAAEERRS